MRSGMTGFYTPGLVADGTGKLGDVLSVGGITIRFHELLFGFGIRAGCGLTPEVRVLGARAFLPLFAAFRDPLA